MSPEQLRGDRVDARSDIFSFGTVFYEMLSGHHPFRAEAAAETISNILRSEAPAIPREGLPATLAQLVIRCLAKSPEGRPQSAKELEAELKELSSAN